MNYPFKEGPETYLKYYRDLGGGLIWVETQKCSWTPWQIHSNKLTTNQNPEILSKHLSEVCTVNFHQMFRWLSFKKVSDLIWKTSQWFDNVLLKKTGVMSGSGLMSFNINCGKQLRFNLSEITMCADILKSWPTAVMKKYTLFWKTSSVLFMLDKKKFLAHLYSITYLFCGE